jgi:GNAT superfamily N-acetyltransferase
MAEIRLFTEHYLPLGLELCRLAGWNQTEADWRRLQALESQGVFVACDHGLPCGTASAISYGSDIGWIGMVLVHPSARGRGIGTQLLERCVQYLRGRRVAHIQLDATDQGRPVYLKMGFAAGRPIDRHAGEASFRAAPDLREIAEADWGELARLDRSAFGADRLVLLHRLAEEGPSAVVTDSLGIAGYGLTRPGHQASFLGPVVARTPQAAEAVIRSLLSKLPRGPTFWDILPDNSAAVRLAAAMGFVPARCLTRMHLGFPPDEYVEHVFGAAGFEFG